MHRSTIFLKSEDIEMIRMNYDWRTSKIEIELKNRTTIVVNVTAGYSRRFSMPSFESFTRGLTLIFVGSIYNVVGLFMTSADLIVILYALIKYAIFR